jgi:hypothetical protein
MTQLHFLMICLELTHESWTTLLTQYDDELSHRTILCYATDITE